MASLSQNNTSYQSIKPKRAKPHTYTNPSIHLACENSIVHLKQGNNLIMAASNITLLNKSMVSALYIHQEKIKSTKCIFFEVSRFHFLVECFSNPFLVSLYMILCPSFLLIYQSQLFISCPSPILF